MLRTGSRPQGEKVMVCIRERPTSANGNEARVAIFGKDHIVPFIDIHILCIYGYSREKPACVQPGRMS